MTRRYKSLMDGGFPYLVATLEGGWSAMPMPSRTGRVNLSNFTMENSVYLQPSIHRRIGLLLLRRLILDCEARGYRANDRCHRRLRQCQLDQRSYQDRLFQMIGYIPMSTSIRPRSKHRVRCSACARRRRHNGAGGFEGGDLAGRQKAWRTERGEIGPTL